MSEENDNENMSLQDALRGIADEMGMDNPPLEIVEDEPDGWTDDKLAEMYDTAIMYAQTAHPTNNGRIITYLANRVTDLIEYIRGAAETRELREYNLTCRALDTTPEGREFLARLDRANAEIERLEIQWKDSLKIDKADYAGLLAEIADIARMEEELEAVRAELAQLREDQRWIPVGERLPDQRIVLWLDRDSGEMATGGLDRVRDDKPIVLVFRSKDGLHYISTFTHWRYIAPPTSD